MVGLHMKCFCLCFYLNPDASDYDYSFIMILFLPEK